MSKLIRILTFIDSYKRITDIMDFCDPKTSEVEKIETFQGVLDETPRKPGSVRPCIIY